MAEANPNPSWHQPSNTRSGLPPINLMKFVKRSMKSKAIMNPSAQVRMQCMKGEDGKFYYIPIDPYNPEHLRFIDEMSPLLVNPIPMQFEKGALYTYIVASIIRKDPGTNRDIEVVPMKLYACKSHNMFELGTKHHQIFYRMALTGELKNVADEKGIDVSQLQYALHASGEIKCINPITLMFNFFSGTYKMQRKVPKRREPIEIEIISTLMNKIDPRYVIRLDTRPFIVPETMSITHEQLQTLNEKGIPTFGFETQQQCRQMQYYVARIKSSEKRTITHDEMREKHKQIVEPPAPPQGTTASRISSFASAVASKAASLFPSFGAASAAAASAPAAPALTSAYAMMTTELVQYAKQHNLPIPDPLDRTTKSILMKTVQDHMSKKGGRKRTIKKRRTLKKK